MKCGLPSTIQSSLTVKIALIKTAIFKVTCKCTTSSNDDRGKELLLRWCAGKSAWGTTPFVLYYINY
jgi:hypothetical protein